MKKTNKYYWSYSDPRQDVIYLNPPLANSGLIEITSSGVHVIACTALPAEISLLPVPGALPVPFQPMSSQSCQSFWHEFYRDIISPLSVVEESWTLMQSFFLAAPFVDWMPKRPLLRIYGEKASKPGLVAETMAQLIDCTTPEVAKRNFECNLQAEEHPFVYATRDSRNYMHEYLTERANRSMLVSIGRTRFYDPPEAYYSYGIPCNFRRGQPEIINPEIIEYRSDFFAASATLLEQVMANIQTGALQNAISEYHEAFPAEVDPSAATGFSIVGLINDELKKLL